MQWVCMNVKRLNFSWLIDGKIAGHGAPLINEDLAYLRSKGIRSLVRMVLAKDALVTPAQIAKYGFNDLHEPVIDYWAPDQVQIDKIIKFIAESLSQDKPVGVSCNAGLGRTGTILACFMVNRGYNSEVAIKEVGLKRPHSIETREQEEAVRIYEERLGQHLLTYPDDSTSSQTA